MGATSRGNKPATDPKLDDSRETVGQIAQEDGGGLPWAPASERSCCCQQGEQSGMKRKCLPLPIVLWFLADAVLALTPQMHHLASGSAPFLGVPRVLAYLLGTSAFTAASVVVAFLVDVQGRGR